jgi:chromosome segregation ATPase
MLIEISIWTSEFVRMADAADLPPLLAGSSVLGVPAASSSAFLASLQRQNARTRASGVVIESYSALLTAHTQLERRHAELQQSATELRQEKNELARDVALLSNASNLGVSATHIQQLQDKVAALHNEASVLKREQADALARAEREAAAAGSARDAFAASELARQAAVDDAHAARATIDALRAELGEARDLAAMQSQRLAAGEAENSALVARYLEKVSAQCDTLNDGVDLHDARLTIESLRAELGQARDIAVEQSQRLAAAELPKPEPS